MDGNTAAAYISYAFTEVAGIFPITPSSPMAEYVDEWAAKGKKNIFGQTVEIVEMQSEAGAAGTVHGSLGAGALTTTYTASQGLLLMIPNMYKIAGELQPGVFHVSARSLSVHALSIFGDHSDVMACRQTGFALLAASNPQEVMDMGAVAHLSAIRGRIPFLHFFDGFRTSHEMQKIETLDYDDLRTLVDMSELAKFRQGSLNPGHPSTRGTTQNPDIYFQQREASNPFFTALPAITENYMNEIGKLTGRDYKLFDYYGAKDAKYLIIAMGSVSDTIRETVDYLNANGGKTGLVNVHLYRPFSVEHMMRVIPGTVERIAVLDRTKEPGCIGEPLYQDVCHAYYTVGKPMFVIGGRYGLSSKDTTPSQIIAVYENLRADEPKNNFTIGINDDVTFLSLPQKEEINISTEGTLSCKIWGMGSDGTVGANKNTAKIIGEHTKLHTQVYFVYDSKKSGGLTQSHLRFGKERIRSPYLVNAADFVACHTPSYVHKYDLLKDVKEGGVLLLNCPWNAEELESKLPDSMKKAIGQKRIRFYTINAIDIAKELGLGGRTNTILQAAFFKLVDIIPIEDAATYMKDAIRKTYAKRGEKVVAMNFAAVDRGIAGLTEVDVPNSWAEITAKPPVKKAVPEFIDKIVNVMNRQEGDSIPVSAFVGIEDGTFPAGTTAYEKPGAAVDVPRWIIENCIQCNQCAYVCPHAAIRPILLDGKELSSAPADFETKKAVGKGLENYAYRIQVSPLDCTGCGSCANVCPAKKKALVMAPLHTERVEAENWTYAMEGVSAKEDIDKGKSVKYSQFAQPLFEFPGACAGCGETPYIKLITQLFGDRMYIANASGCSTAYGGSTPSMPYTKNRAGRGPAWAMSLFEDCAEYAYGMLLGSEKIRERIRSYAAYLSESALPEAAKRWIETMEDSKESQRTSDVFENALRGYKAKSAAEKEQVDFILENKDFLPHKSYWAFGGDGWAYDIGYGGLDHVLASGKNINMLVLDTEVYSNTGGQSSKSTAAGAIAKFNSSGKKTKKKDLGMMAMSYGYVYVAQVAMGYDQAQTLKAILEAEAYPGPSLVIAYCPCIEHGLKSGMTNSQLEMKRAVEAGYWHLYRYNPLLKNEGKNPFILDSKEPTADLKEFLRGEIRYSSLEIAFPDHAEELFGKAVNDAKERLETYQRLARG
jgi:pyruvate-ferredoxin/flavodoxin oxidoreductase